MQKNLCRYGEYAERKILDGIKIFSSVKKLPEVDVNVNEKITDKIEEKRPNF